MSDRKQKWTIIFSMFKIGCIGFGGGSALIPVIEREVVGKQRQKQSDYDKTVVVASITPGALPVEIATGTGREYGISGMLGSACAMAFPGALLTVLLLTVLAGLSNTLLRQISWASILITPLIIAYLLLYIWNVMKEARGESSLRLWKVIIICLGVFLLTGGKGVYRLFSIEGQPLFSLSTIAVLGIACFGIVWMHGEYTVKRAIFPGIIIGLYLLDISNLWKWDGFPLSEIMVGIMILMTVFRGYQSFTQGASKERKVSAEGVGKEMLAWLAVVAITALPAVLLVTDAGEYLIKGFLSSVLSFGGGDAYLIVADGMFVDSGMVSQEGYYGHLVPVVNVLPGSILCKTLTGVGYLIGCQNGAASGILLAAAGFFLSVSASGIVYCLVYYLYQRFEKIEVFQLLRRWIRPIVSGLLINVMISLLNQGKISAGKVGCSGVVIAVGILIVGVIIFCWMNFRRKKSL